MPRWRLLFVLILCSAPGEAPSLSFLDEVLFLTIDQGHLPWVEVECCTSCTTGSAHSQRFNRTWHHHGALLQPLWQPGVYPAGHLLHRVVHPATGLHHRACHLRGVLWHPASVHENIVKDFWGKSFPRYWRNCSFNHKCYSLCKLLYLCFKSRFAFCNLLWIWIFSMLFQHSLSADSSCVYII